MKQCLVWIILLLIFVNESKSQDLNFSQFYEMPLWRNPALAGLYNCNFRIGIAHRSQWGSVTVPYQTSALDIEYKFPIFNQNDYLSIALQATYDVAGDVKLKRTQLLPVINYHKSMSDNADDYLSLAFMAGPVQSQFDPTKARLDDQFVNGIYSPNNATGQTFSRTGYSYFDMSTGLSYTSGFGTDSRFYFGAAMFHANKPKINFYNGVEATKLATRWAVNAGLKAPTSDYARVLGYADYYLQGGNRQFIAGMLYETDLEQYSDDDKISLAFGGCIRLNDAIIPVVKINFHQFKIAVSYDANISKLSTASQLQGGFELTASFTNCLSARNAVLEKTRCIRF